MKIKTEGVQYKYPYIINFKGGPKIMRYFIKSFIPIIFVLLLSIPASSHDYGYAAETVTYNSGLIGTGIGFYYAQTGQLPDSIDVLFQDGFIPPNLPNPYSGGIISGNSVNGNPGEWKIERTDGENLILTYYGTGDPMTFNYSKEFLDRDVSNLIMDQLKEQLPAGANIADVTLIKQDSANLPPAERMAGLMNQWAHACLNSYFNAYNKVPVSIDDLKNVGLWPFEGRLNYMSGKPMRFDSQEPGDMEWTFSDGKVLVRQILTPENGVKRLMATGYPSTIVKHAE